MSLCYLCSEFLLRRHLQLTRGKMMPNVFGKRRIPLLGLVDEGQRDSA
jgi:hypothetical protein